MKSYSAVFILLLILLLTSGRDIASAVAATDHRAAAPPGNTKPAPSLNLHSLIHTILGAPPTFAACPTPVKVMPLGDSITKGVYGSGYPDTRPDSEIVGYRLPLYVGLRNSGYNVDFVGSQTAGSAYPGLDINHEGHPGKSDGYIANNVYDYLEANSAEIILLHIGTNQLNTSAADVDTILDNIKQYQDDHPGTDITVILARIINRVSYSSQTTQFNDNVETMIAGHPFKNNVVKVDMEDGAGIDYAVTPDGDMADNLHPYATGYEKMAPVWLNAINGLGLSTCSLPPLIHATSTTAYVGQLFKHQVPASGNPAPTFELIVSPAGMTINGATGEINWTPGSAGPANVTVKATNSQGFDQQSFTVEVTDTPVAPAINPIPSQNAIVATPFTYDVDADGNPAPTFSLVAPVLDGMTINASTGLISWTPGAAGTFDVTVKATNSEGFDDQSFTITVLAPPAITPIPGQNAAVNTLFTYDVEASGNPVPAFGLLEPAPEGMTINATTGLISWAPFAAGTFDVTVSATNSAGTDDETFTVEVVSTPAITPIPDPTLILDQPFTYDVEASGHPAPTFSLTQKPAGMAIDPTTGVISWTPAATGTFNVTVEAINSQGVDPESFTITVLEEFLLFLPLTVGN